MLVALLLVLTQNDMLEAMAVKVDFSPPREITEMTLEERDALRGKGAIIGMCIAFVAFGSIHFPNTIMTRPHTLIWRMLLAMFCLYAMFITYIFLLPRE